MAGFTFTTPDGRSFEIKGPPGLTQEQARAIFDRQAKAGSLVGLRSGDALSAATQAAAGLSAAEASVQQALSGVNGSLGSVNVGVIGSVNPTLGASGGALGGSLSGTAAGLSGAVGAATAGVKQVLATGSLPTTATASISTINRTLASTPVANAIDAADFAKQDTALAPIGSMDTAQVTGVLAQAKTLVAQDAAAMSNSRGLGEYGLTVSQLETAGIVKPGMSTLVDAGASITSVLKSPAAFTGVAGVKSVSDLLTNPSLQSSIQQELMAKGVAGLTAAGIPTDLLNAEGLAGMALNAAKNLPNAVDFANGLPVPDAAALAANVREAAFAAKLAESKIPPAWKAETVPEPESETVNRGTVDAATRRVLGNEKVPEPNYGPAEPTPEQLSSDGQFIGQNFAQVAPAAATFTSKIEQLNSSIADLESKESIAYQDWAALDAQYLELINDWNENALNKYYNPALERFNSTAPDIRRAQQSAADLAQNEVKKVAVLSAATRKRINALKAKITP